MFLVGHNWKRSAWMVSPEIVIGFRDFTTDTEELEQRIVVELNRSGSARRLAQLLEPALDAKTVELRWRSADGLTTLQTAATATVTEVPDQAPLVVL